MPKAELQSECGEEHQSRMFALRGREKVALHPRKGMNSENILCYQD
jgi:hypothetical protein